MLDDPNDEKNAEKSKEELRKRNNRVRFYRVRGADLDDEMREILDNQDLLEFL